MEGSSAAEAPRERALDLSRLHRSELIGFVGSAVLFASLFLPWFGTNDNPRAEINAVFKTNTDFTAWETFGQLDWWLVAACSAPFILAYIIIRGHDLTWRPGEITMIVGMTAAVLIVLNGIVLGRPGEPDSEISIKIGYFVGILGGALICVGGIIRQAEGGRGRKPPGSL